MPHLPDPSQPADADEEMAPGSPISVTLSPLLLSIHQVCAMLGGISERKVRGLVASGKFPRPVKIDRLSRWRPADVSAWCATLAA